MKLALDADMAINITTITISCTSKVIKNAKDE